MTPYARSIGSRIVCAIVLGVAIGPVAPVQAESAAAVEMAGARLYREACASCHGPDGRGDGLDAELYEPRPRNLRTGFLDRYETDEFVRRVRDGAPLEITFDLAALRARALDTEAVAAHLRRLPDIEWRRLEVGQEVFVDRCEICHGPFGRGRAPLPPGVRRPRDLADPAFQAGISDQELLGAVRHGRKGMPAITPPVPESEAADLATFVRLLSPGFELYSRFCAACHGDDGYPSSRVGETALAPTLAFDRAYVDGRDPDALRASIWHMISDQKRAMPHLRSAIDEAEARAIIEYLRGADREG